MKKLLFFIASLVSSCSLGFTVIGTKDFVSKVEGALDFMQQYSLSSYQESLSYVGYIRQSSRSGANFDDKKIDLNVISCPDKYWCSSVIYHESIHFKQLAEGRYDKMSASAIEFEANYQQLKYLEKVSAPAYMINHLRREIVVGSNHSDVNGDGVYDEYDYQQRNY